MKTGIRDIFMAFAIFVIGVDFFSSFFLYGKFTTTYAFPVVSSYVNYGTAYAKAINDLGGGWTFLGYSLGFIEAFFAGLLSVPIFLYNVFTFVYLAVVYLFTFITFPFALIPYPFNLLFQSIFYLIIGIGFLFGIRVAQSGIW